MRAAASNLVSLRAGAWPEAEAVVPTRHGAFRFVLFDHDCGPEGQPIALVAGDPSGEDVLVRVHSECMTSEVFGSLRCDCREQLDTSLDLVAAEGRGAVVYLRHEGRGIGLASKLRAYALQSQGLDTVDANRALGLPDDARRYVAAVAVLRALGVESVRLLTNNPDKVAQLEALGMPVRERVPLIIPARPESEAYLAAKRDRMSHWL